MDDLQLGLAFRRVRLRRNERQADVAARAGISRTTYSRIERGHLDGIPLRAVRAVAAALDMRVELVPRWRGGDLDRLIHGRHAMMSDAVVARLEAGGWDVAPEYSFNRYGERGVADIVAWHAPTRSLLIAELKTELVDINELLASMDRRCRVIPRTVADRGWRPDRVSAWLVIAESRTNRRHAAALASVLRAAFPDDGRGVRGWLRRPERPQRALWFLTDDHPGTLGRSLAPTKRVRRPRTSTTVSDGPGRTAA